MSNTMIFHYPMPIVKNADSGSQVRPYQMLKAFKELGYEVEVVAGYANERKRSIKCIESKIMKGKKYSFVYAESYTMPTLLTEPSHIPIHPFLDFRFLYWLKNLKVPIGLFYRDIYWRYDFYKNSLPWYKHKIAVLFYYYDWWQYLRIVDHLFLQSMKMRHTLPTIWPKERLSALPPGCEIRNICHKNSTVMKKMSKLFYVGGITPPVYDLKPMIDAVKNIEGIILTICCRQIEWERVKSYYGIMDKNKICIVHVKGEALTKYYMEADLFLFVPSYIPYRDFCVPVKLFESIGYGVPILTTAGTEVTRIVQNENFGWVVSSIEELKHLLFYLRTNPKVLAKKRKQVSVVREKHTWQVRAQQVVSKIGKRREFL